MEKRKNVHGAQRGLQSFSQEATRMRTVREVTKRLFEGRFGRMFADLEPAVFDPHDLKKLAIRMIAELDVTPEDEEDEEENRSIPAGYTYLGQFIDHDLTFDPTTPSQRQIDLDALIDYRTPAFDLDNIYGRGPDDQPYLYEDGVKFVLGKKLFGNPVDPNTHDLPRSVPLRGAARALIGDPRNDENVIVSQLQGIFLRFHNSVVDYYRGKGENRSFDEIRNEVRWHYQWMIINDFLPTIIRKDVINKILPHLERGGTIHDHAPRLELLKDEIREPYMPVEFSVAAYRFGHSMVRPLYRLNQYHQRLFIFPDLVGFDAVADNLAIDWRLFFNMGTDKPKSAERIQPSYKIDTSLVMPLGSLPSTVAPLNIPSLAEANLIRGSSLGLPSGQDVALKLGVTPIPDEKLTVADKNETGKNIPIVEVSEAFRGKAPLWFYILAEAMQDINNGEELRLGEVGGRIVGEVFLWLMLKDPTSVFGKLRINNDDNQLKPEPWTPIGEFQSNGKFGIKELILQAQRA